MLPDSFKIKMVIVCLAFLQALPAFPSPESIIFSHRSQYIYTWSKAPDHPGSMQQFASTKSDYRASVPIPEQTSQLIHLKWRNTESPSLSQVCLKRTGSERANIAEVSRKDAVAFSYTGVTGLYDCFTIQFQSSAGGTLVAVSGGYFEPLLTKRILGSNLKDDTTASFRVDVYSASSPLKDHQTNHNHNSSSFGGFSGGSSAPLNSVSSSSSTGNSPPKKPPYPSLQVADVEVVISPYILNFLELPEQPLTAGAYSGSGTDISIDIFVNEQLYRLRLSLDEWRILVERNLHRSALALLNLARQQSDKRYEFSLLVQELDNALGNTPNNSIGASRIRQLLNEYDDTPPEKIYIHSWLTATALYYLLQKTGYEIADTDQHNPEEYLNKLEQLIQQLGQSNQLQQLLEGDDAIDDAIDDTIDDTINDTINESAQTAYFQPDSAEALLQLIKSKVHKQWQKWLARSLASITPSPTLIQASTDGTSAASGSKASTTSQSSQTSSTAISPQSTPGAGNGEETRSGEGDGNGEDDRDDQPLPPLQEKANPWALAIRKTFNSIVKLEYIQAKDHNGILASHYTASGFVVDAERGIILTNKHAGVEKAVIARARFDNGDSVSLTPLYCDPENDFGFYKYDPQSIEASSPTALSLAPSEAYAGAPVMLIGSDVGERKSIFQSHLSFLERNPPGFDMNTFYFLMAAATSDGSSGSPVINQNGDVVALNAGKKLQGERSTAGALLLPIDRAAEALGYLQKGEVPPRGTLLTTFIHKTKDDLKSAGLSKARLTEVKNTDYSGLLTVNTVVPEGPADHRLKNGDILLKVNGQWASDFNVLVGALNANVGQPVSLEVERNKQLHTIEVPVLNAHSITPNKLLEYSGGVFHNIYPTTAISYNLPLKGVAVAKRGSYFYRLLPKDIILNVDDQDISSLEDFVDVIKEKKEGDFLRIIYIRPKEGLTRKFALLKPNYQFFGTSILTREYGKSRWYVERFARPAPRTAAISSSLSEAAAELSSLEIIKRLLVEVELTVPFNNAGLFSPDSSFEAMLVFGVILDEKKGLVAINTSAHTTPLFSAKIIFQGREETPATVYKIHPKLGITLLKYRPELVQSEVLSAKLHRQKLESGVNVKIVSADRFGELKISDNQLLSPFSDGQRLFITKATTQAAIDQLKKQAEEHALRRQKSMSARYSLESYEGVITNMEGDIIGLNLFLSIDRYPTFITSEQILQFLSQIDQGQNGVIDLGVGVHLISMLESRQHGVSQSRLEQKPREKPGFLQVSDVDQMAPAAQLLNTGDVLLEINNIPVYDYSDVQLQIQSRSAESIPITFLRFGSIQKGDVKTVEYPFTDFQQVINWQGLVIHKAMRHLGVMSEFRYGNNLITSVNPGSTAMLAGALYFSIIKSVGGIDTPDLNSLLTAVRGAADNDFVKLELLDLLNDKPATINIRVDLTYWPTRRYQLDDNGQWNMEVLSKSTVEPQASTESIEKTPITH